MKGKSKISGVIVLVVILLPMLFFSKASMAVVCKFKSEWTPMNVKYINMPDTLTIDNSVPVGSVVYSFDYVMTSTDKQIADCPGPGQWAYFIRNGTPDLTVSISETNVSGLGWKVYSTVRYTTSGYAPVFGQYNATPTGAWINAGDFIRVELIKTKEIVGSGTLNPRRIATFGLFHDNFYYPGLYIDTNKTTEIISKTCEVIGDKNKVINFGNVINKKLSSVSGVVPGTQKDIVIDLRCNPGTKIAVTYDSQYKESGLHSSVKNQGTAKGVYIHFPSIGRLGQSNTVITSSKETETIRNTVELYRYGTFKSGSISGQATYTLNYE